jgi:hypothetical protein
MTGLKDWFMNKMGFTVPEPPDSKRIDHEVEIMTQVIRERTIPHQHRSLERQDSIIDEIRKMADRPVTSPPGHLLEDALMGPNRHRPARKRKR